MGSVRAKGKDAVERGGRGKFKIKSKNMRECELKRKAKSKSNSKTKCKSQSEYKNKCKSKSECKSQRMCKLSPGIAIRKFVVLEFFFLPEGAKILRGNPSLSFTFLQKV